MEPTAVPPQPTPSVPPAKKNTTLVFILLAIIILLLGLGGGYFLKGQQTSPSPTPTPMAQNPTPTSEQPTTAPSVPQGKATWTTYTSTKLDGVSFTPYSIQYPSDWTPSHKVDTLTDTYTLTKEGYELKIYQAPMGGNGCIFEGELPEGPMQDLRSTKFTEIETASGVKFRRFISSNPIYTGKTVYEFCSTSNGTDWGTPTSFGAITYMGPRNASETVFMEMDTLLKTLQKAQ